MLDLDNLKLLRGNHESREDGVCAMEAVAWMAGEAHSDAPACTCPVIAQLVRSWNEALPDADRDRLLKPLLPLLVGTRSSPEVEGQRAYMALDWLIRENAAAWLELANLSDDATALRALAPVADMATSVAAQRVVLVAREHASAAAAWAVAWAAAAAWIAAWAVAWAAAANSADDGGAAAWGAAADDTAGAAAAGAALRPTAERLQQSCVELIRRMCEIE